jgi:hypothetical protein
VVAPLVMLNASAGVAVQLAFFKDAWKNRVMHGRRSCDEQEAAAIYDSVRRFMQQMAQGLRT